MKREVKVLECTNPLCRYRWITRVDKPKACPECKRRLTGYRMPNPTLKIVEVDSTEELRNLKIDINKWNEKTRWICVRADVPRYNDLTRITKCATCEIPLDDETAMPIVLINYKRGYAFTFCSQNCLLLWLNKKSKSKHKKISSK